MLPVLAQAEWVQKEIRWTVSGVTGDGSSIYVRDTTRVVLGGGTTTLDTTGWFSIASAMPLPRGIVAPGLNGISGNQSGGVAAYQSDTTVIGYLVFQADSTAAPTASLTSISLLIDGRVGGLGPNTTLARGWVKSDSIVISSASGLNMTGATDESIAIPIRTIGVYGSIFKWNQLRARTIAATGILSAARAYIRYWRPAVAGSSE